MHILCTLGRIVEDAPGAPSKTSGSSNGTILKHINKVMSETHQVSDQVHPSSVHLVSHMSRPDMQ